MNAEKKNFSSSLNDALSLFLKADIMFNIKLQLLTFERYFI